MQYMAVHMAGDFWLESRKCTQLRTEHQVFGCKWSYLKCCAANLSQVSKESTSGSSFASQLVCR